MIAAYVQIPDNLNYEKLLADHACICAPVQIEIFVIAGKNGKSQSKSLGKTRDFRVDQQRDNGGVHELRDKNFFGERTVDARARVVLFLRDEQDEAQLERKLNSY